jgi:hypothetical protein
LLDFGEKRVDFMLVQIIPGILQTF